MHSNKIHKFIISYYLWVSSFFTIINFKYDIFIIIIFLYY